MHDAPSPAQITEAATLFLRERVMPALGGFQAATPEAQAAASAVAAATAHHARVAANLLDIARRQLLEDPAVAAAEVQRLQALLDRTDTDLAALNQALAEAIAAGRLSLDSPGLAAHLWHTTLAKLAVDQPNYATYRRAIGG